MKRFILRLCGLVTAAAVLLCLTGCGPKEVDTGAGRMFTAVIAGDPECLDPQFTENQNAEIVIRNVMEGLLRRNTAGELVPAGAESYTVSEDGRTYIFSLRTNAYWFGKNTDPERPERVTSRDYVFAFRRLVDPAMRSPYGEDYACIQNAAAILAGEDDPKHLGVTAPDPNTVQFDLAYPNPNFPELLARTCAVPCQEEFFESTNGRYGLDEDTILCNGGFYLTQWNYDQYSSGNFLTFRKAENYHDPDTVFPKNLQFNIMHTREGADNDFAGGNADVLLTDVYHKQYLHDKDYVVEMQAATTMGLIFNLENEILRNENIRLALASSIDRSAIEPLLSEDVTMAYGLVPPAVTVLGSSYRSIQADEPLATPYDPKQAQELFAQAVDELGIGTMNSIRVLVPSTLPDTDALLAMSQNWQDLFGYYIGIETVTPDEFSSRIASGDYSIALYSITPGRNSLYEALRAYTDRAGFLGFNAEDILLLEGLAKPVKLADTAALAAETEKLILDTHTFIPIFYKNRYLIATAGNQDILFDPFRLSADFKEAKHFAE